MSDRFSTDSLDFKTKYGNVKLTAATSSDFPDLDIREELNTVEIDDNPCNTYGLASKFFVTSSLEAHEESPDAHHELFNTFIRQLYDLYESQGQLRIDTLSDVYDNKIYANRKVIVNGDVEHPKYLVLSDDRNADYDALLRRVEALEAALGLNSASNNSEN